MSRSIRWRGTGIHTASSLANKRRRLDRHSAGVEQVLGELRRGAALHLSFSPRKHWRLSSGAFVTDEVARTVIGLPCVASVDGALFEGVPSQTYRYCEDDWR